MTIKKARVPAKGANKNPIRRVKLKNGLSVLLIENHKAPVVSVQMWVKTGSADEGKGEEGISHFIEHLVFKGTDKYGMGEIASTVEASGGELNAYTSFDQTVFYVNISREFSEVALDVISEMMGFPRFDSGEIDNEREVVIEEIKRSNDSPGRQASRLLFSTVYKNHPYGIPVIGYDRIIKKVTRKTLLSYYQSRYIPTNMHLVVAGDFDSREMHEAIDQRFGRLKPFKLRRVKRKTEPKQAGFRVKVAKAPFEEAQIHLAWRIPGAHHKDVAALDMLAMILGQGDSSRLTKKLRLEAALTNSIGAGTFTPKDTGLFTVSGSLNPEQLPAALEAIKAELLLIASEPPTADEMKRAVTNLESEEFYAMETIEGVARKAGSFENLMGDYAYFQKFLKQIYALKPDDIMKTARKYLALDQLSFVMMTPRNEKDAEKLVKTWAKAYAKDFAVAKKAKSKPSARPKLNKVKWTLAAGSQAPSAIERRVLPSGAILLARVDRATPVLSAKAAFLGGVRHESNSQGGLTELVSRTWTTGTKDLDEAEIARRIENMAGGLGAFGGRNSVGLSMQTISPFEADAISLFDELLVAPVVNEAAVEREKVVMLEAIRSRQDNPSHLVSQLFSQTMFKGHPYARDTYGTPETVKTLGRGAVDTYLQSVLMSKNLMISIAGSVDVDLWEERLTKATARLEVGKPLTANFTHEGPKKNQFEFKKLEREQSHIIIGAKGLTLDDPRRYTLQVMQSILAGQGGRLFLELRDKASLAYSVSPMRMEGVDTGYFGAYIGCSPEKGKKALEMLHIEFRKLADTNVPLPELERAKRYLIGRHDIDLQRSSSISSSILFNEIYGIPAEETFQYADRLRDITPDMVREIAAEIFARPFITCAVGPVEPWS
ncbi:MAG: pitrilysin family protein [Bdellovibrionota bacterium]